jgi:hypothetical protein
MSTQGFRLQGLAQLLLLGVAGLLVLTGCGGPDMSEPQGRVTVEPGPQQAATIDQELQVVCDAEQAKHLGGGANFVYLVELGAPLECTVTGLAADLDATWHAQLFDDEIADADHATHEFAGKLVVANGEASFTVRVPRRPPLMWLVTQVSQGDRQASLRGQTHWYWERPMTCLPDPATNADLVECRADDLHPSEHFHWDVTLYDSFGSAVEWINGSDDPDADGGVAFTFEVPDKMLYRYRASANQQYHNAVYSGSIR